MEETVPSISQPGQGQGPGFFSLCRLSWFSHSDHLRDLKPGDVHLGTHLDGLRAGDLPLGACFYSLVSGHLLSALLRGLRARGLLLSVSLYVARE